MQGSFAWVVCLVQWVEESVTGPGSRQTSSWVAHVRLPHHPHSPGPRTYTITGRHTFPERDYTGCWPTRENSTTESDGCFLCSLCSRRLRLRPARTTATVRLHGNQPTSRVHRLVVYGSPADSDLFEANRTNSDPGGRRAHAPVSPRPPNPSNTTVEPYRGLHVRRGIGGVVPGPRALCRAG